MTDGPPDGEHSEEPLVRRGDELEEHSRVHGQVPADPEVPRRDERAERDGGWGAARSDHEHASDEEGEVERYSKESVLEKSGWGTNYGLETYFLPQMSHPTPQKTAPKVRPMLCARMRNGPGKPGNSAVTGLMMRAVSCCTGGARDQCVVNDNVIQGKGLKTQTYQVVSTE